MPINLAVHVEQRATRVAAVDGGVGLDVVVERTGVDCRDRPRARHDGRSVTVPPRPNGLPTAITGWPTRTLVASAKVTNGSGLSLSTLIKARVGLLVAAHHLGPAACGRPPRVTVIESGLAGDMEVGDDPAVGVDDEARADSLGLLRLTLLRLHLRLAGLALLAEALGEALHELFHLLLLRAVRHLRFLSSSAAAGAGPSWSRRR